MIEYPLSPWSEHLEKLAFRQGEHILVSGPTSAGKTTLIRPIVEKRGYVIALFTKIKDPTIKKEFKDFKRFDRWPKYGFSPDEKRIMIWPSPERTLRATINKQKAVMTEAINNIARLGGYCVLIDEMLYMVEPRYLNLGAEIGMLHYFGRSAGVSAVTLAQRPFNIPRVVLSSVTHAYFSRTYDAGDQKRLSELGSMNPREIIANMRKLENRHDFMYLNPQGDAPSVIVNTRRERLSR